MSAGAWFDYRQKRKRDWRGWNWNRIAERIPTRARDAVVVGFFGAEAHDIREAEKRGFRRENLISIERVEDAAKHARRNGANVFLGECDDFLEAWDDRVQVDAILLDFCGSMTFKQLATARHVATWPGLKPWGVIAANLLAGHEENLGLCKKVVREYGAASFESHRGAMFHASVNMWSWVEACRALGISEQELARRALDRLPSMPHKAAKPAIFSYLSQVGAGRSNRFDSVVFNRWFAFASSPGRRDPSPARMSIAALRAWRTRRLAAS